MCLVKVDRLKLKLQTRGSTRGNSIFNHSRNKRFGNSPHARLESATQAEHSKYLQVIKFQPLDFADTSVVCQAQAHRPVATSTKHPVPVRSIISAVMPTNTGKVRAAMLAQLCFLGPVQELSRQHPAVPRNVHAQPKKSTVKRC